jgi:hypothetical protein
LLGVYEDALVSIHFELELKIVVMMDEYTTLSKRKAFVICVELIPLKLGPTFAVLGKVNNMSAYTVLDSTLGCLHEHRFT